MSGTAYLPFFWNWNRLLKKLSLQLNGVSLTKGRSISFPELSREEEKEDEDEEKCDENVKWKPWKGMQTMNIPADPIIYKQEFYIC